MGAVLLKCVGDYGGVHRVSKARRISTDRRRFESHSPLAQQAARRHRINCSVAQRPADVLLVQFVGFTEFEQRTAYFDGDIVEATKKGVNPLERRSQVDFMADFQEIIDFPPAPKLDVLGKLDPAKRRRPKCAGRRCSSARASARAATSRLITPIT
jgi:hypothetical protein